MAMKTYVFLFILSINYAYSQSALLERYLKDTENYNISRQSDSLKKYANLARELAIKEGKEAIIYKAEFFLGNAIMRTYPDSSVKLIKRSFEDFKGRNDFKFLTTSSGALGNYYAQLGSQNEALKYYLQGREYAEKYYSVNETERYPRIIAASYHNIATSYMEMAEYEKAMENSMKAMKIANQNNLKLVEMVSLMNMGSIQEKLKQDNLAEKYFNQALEISNILNDINRKGVIYSNLGSIYFNRAKSNHNYNISFDQAIKNFTEALEIAKAQKDYYSISLRLTSLSELKLLKHDVKKSNELLFEALNYAELSKAKTAKLMALTGLSENFFYLNNFKEAINNAEKAISIAKETKNVESLPKLYEILKKSYTQEKDFVKALEFQKAQMTAKDSLYKSSTTSKILELQTKYETEKKQKAIELLTVKNQVNEAQIKQKNYLIIAISALVLSLCGGFFFWFRQRKLKDKQQASDMKQRLLRAQLNPNFLFNCLNSIQRLYVDGKFMQANEFIADFAQLMRDILEKTGRTTIPLYEEMDFIEAYLSLEKRRLGDKFDYEIIMDDEVRNGDFEVPSFIVQPLAENALLHGILPKNLRGKIEVIVDRLQDDSLSITVKDDGVGYYHSLQKAGKHTSKGMELIKSRLGKQGKMLIEELKNLNQEILGTKITLELNM
jgi:tetratricopeptide (TPR) repeat protein